MYVYFWAEIKPQIWKHHEKEKKDINISYITHSNYRKLTLLYAFNVVWTVAKVTVEVMYRVITSAPGLRLLPADIYLTFKQQTPTAQSTPRRSHCSFLMCCFLMAHRYSYVILTQTSGLSYLGGWLLYTYHSFISFK